MNIRVLVLLGGLLGLAARAETLEVPKAPNTSMPAAATPAFAVSVATPIARAGSRAGMVAPSSSQVAQGEQLAILHQERRALLATLDAENHAAKKPGAPSDSADRIRRAQADLQSIDREIARAAKEPPPTVSNSTPGATTAPIGSVARAAVTSTASTVSPTTTPSTADTAFEGWDVFRNFGKQGALQ